MSFQPDIIALSCTEDMFNLGLALIERVQHLKILTIAGGVYPEHSPRSRFMNSHPCIDIVCKGEGGICLNRAM